jgi:DNA repair protein RecO (recombination protein O)
MTSRVYQTEGIIVKKHKFGEADRLLTLFTADHGKVRAIAKGAMRPKSKLGGNVELLTHSKLLLARGRNLDIITQAQVINNFLPVRDNLELMACGFYLCELVDTFTEENVEDKELFTLFLNTLSELSAAREGERILRYFELRALSHQGYRPQLQRCSNCNRELEPETNYFSPAQGGALCRACGYPDMNARTISLNALKVLRLWLKCDFETARRVKLTPDLTQEIKKLMGENIKYVLEKQLKSIEWIDKLATEHGPANKTPTTPVDQPNQP